MTPNEKAFLDMLAISEGTDRIGDHGYNCLVGGTTFAGYAHHPGIRVALPRKGQEPLYSTAAGRYQFRLVTWNELAGKLHLKDFGPAAQDAGALELIRERGALQDVQMGRIESAISKCRTIWASLPGAGYGQHENALGSLLAAYQAHGGVLA